MKVLLNPIILSLLLAIFIAVASICTHTIFKGKVKLNLLNLETAFTFTFFTLILIGDAQSYIGNLSLQYLASHADNRNAQLYIILQFVVYGLMIFLARSRVKYLFKAVLLLMRDPFLFGLLILTVVSSFWSQTPLETFKASLVLFGLVIYSSIIAVRCNFQELSKYLCQFGAWIAGSSIALQMLLPSLLKNDKGGWQGIAGHPNTLGYVMALAAIFWGINALDRPHDRRWLSIVITGAATLVMFMTNSSGTLVTFIIIVCLLSIFRILSRLDLRLAWVAIPLLLVVGIPSILLMLRYKEILFALIGKDENLTGRGEFWPAIVTAIEQHPAFGYGYNGFWQSWRGVENPAAHIRTINIIPTHSHNGFLELALALGLVGVTLFVLSFIKNAVYLLMLLNSGKKLEAETSVILLAFIIYSNLSEPGLWDVGYHITLYTLVSVRLGLEVKNIKFTSKNHQQLAYNSIG